MHLKIGEISKRTGLTVRALRHYDDIGLLVSSQRSSGGYRLYTRTDVARLYRVQALRRLNLSLAEIQALLDSGDGDVAQAIALQVAQLERDIRQDTALRDHLLAVQSVLQSSEEPEMDDWLVALESMAVGGRYFSDDELQRLQAQRSQAGETERAALLDRLHSLVAANASPECEDAQQLATRWISLLLEEAGGDEGVLMKLHAMHWNEPSLHALTGVDRAGMRFISQAMACARLGLYGPHCSDEEMATLRRHYVAQTDAWPPLIAEGRRLMAEGAPADGAEAHVFAQRWRALSLAKVGGDAALHTKLQAAAAADAALRKGSGIDSQLSGYVDRAIAQLDTIAAS